MTTFFNYLIRELEQEDPLFRDSVIIQLDNAAWHTNSVLKNRLAKMKLSVIYSGPYSYTTAPIEMLFAALKLSDLNP